METKQVDGYSKQYGLSSLLENIKALKPKSTYYLFEKDYANTVYSLIKFGFEKGYLSKAVDIEVSFFYKNEDVVAFKVEGKDILKYNGEVKFFHKDEEKLRKTLKELKIEEVAEEDRMIWLCAI